MAIDRNKAFEISNDGLLLEGGSHFSSGVGAPTHSGLRGDLYLNTTNFSLYRLAVDGTTWGLISAKEIFFDNTGTLLVATDAEAAIKEITNTVATGLLSYVLTSDITFSTDSASDVLITGFTVTPDSGRYAVYYSSDIVISQNNRIAQNVIYVDGAAVSNTRRRVQGISANFAANQQTVGQVIVSGSQVVDVRVNVSAGALDVNQRSLVLLRLGS